MSKFRIAVLIGSVASVMMMASGALAQNVAVAKDPVLVDCKITPAVSDAENYPSQKTIIHSNKLVKPAGKSLPANGQYLVVTGRLTDENCVPISGAIIDLWQANVDGKYVYATKAELLNPYATFAGTGRATTDNLGRFTFHTLFPGAYGNRAPHLHFRVMHEDFSPLTTEMFFFGDRRNTADKVVSGMSYSQRQQLMGDVSDITGSDGQEGLKVQFDIALKGKNKFRRF